MNEREEWRAIPGYEGRYEVSTHGRVRSLRFINRNCNYLLSTPKILKQTPRDGYRTVNLSVSRVHYKRNVHRLVLLTFVGPEPPGHEGAHRDGNRANNYLTNLRWSTSSENTEDKRLHGTMELGVQRYNAKLTDETVVSIRRSYVKGSKKHGAVALARKHGVHQSTIWRVLNSMAWTHISEQQS